MITPDFQLNITEEQCTHFYFNTSFQNLFADLQTRYTRLCFVVDKLLFNLQPALFQELNPVIVIRGDEKAKTWHQAGKLIQEFIRHDIDKHSLVVAIGGGALTDLVGFAAAVYLRGLSLALVPTTLLAAVDAAIGGKNGVNTSLYKNFIGTIRQPDHWIFDTRFLVSLPKTEWASGFAEVIKYGYISHPTLLEQLHSHALSDFIAGNADITSIVQQCVRIKAAVVQQDPNDQNIRRILNFGHTLGHAIEKRSRIRHGYAVAIGMVLAIKLSHQFLGLEQSVISQLVSLLKQYQLPAETRLKLDEIWQAVLKDKKKSGDKVDFILLEKVGKALRYPLPLTDLHQALELIF